MAVKADEISVLESTQLLRLARQSKDNLEARTFVPVFFLASTKAKEVEVSVCLVMMPGGLVRLDLSLLVVLLMLSAFLALLQSF